MRPRSYEEIAEKFGVEFCQRPFGSDNRDHDIVGDASSLPPTVHWRERRITVSGLRRFLMLVAMARWPEKHLTGPRWLQIYNQNVTAVELSHLIGRRLNQRRFAAANRERVRYLLFRAPPSRLSPDELVSFALARKWINRYPSR